MKLKFGVASVELDVLDEASNAMTFISEGVKVWNDALLHEEPELEAA